MKPRSRYIAHSSSFTHERSSSRARCSARRSRPGSARTPRSGRFALLARRLRKAETSRAIVGIASAMATSVNARTVSSTARSAAGRAREEDHAVGAGRNLVELVDHHGLAPAAPGRMRRHGRPHALVELAAELLDEALLVLAHLRIPLREEDLAVAGAHPQELHRPERLCQPPEGVHRPRAVPDVA